ncbi:MAG: GNAT family N-acetyltransferase [Spirochaetes bacterium]|nr:GNAT family N-acetyltransferase [Spirochaetota bacterium]
MNEIRFPDQLSEYLTDSKWRKIKKKDISKLENFLRETENDYVNACGKFLARDPLKDCFWILQDESGNVKASIINSKNMLIPVFCGLKEIKRIKFLKSFLRFKKIHSVQGLREEVIVLENVLEKLGKAASDIYDYDLMSLDTMPSKEGCFKGPKNLRLRVPQMIDLDALAPLQAGYEKEEVLPRGSTFSPAASRVNIANIIAKGQILAAELDGKMVGKINVNAVSFTRYQVGGVYVSPDFRGMGIAGRMATEFIASLVSEGMGITLFVKKNNIFARRLYDSIGFKLKGDYRIAYY